VGIEHKRAEEELRHTYDQLRELLAHSPAVIYRLKFEGPNVIPTFVSDHMQRLLDVTVKEAMSYDWWFNSLHPEDRDRMVAIRADSRREDGYTAEYRIRHSDGTYRWVVDNNRIVHDAAGEPQEAVGVWTDITERKREEAELERTHSELMETSRQAGMADVATSVLHNVGNVLNSVNVASTCLANSLRKSKVVNLSKVVALLRDHEADLGAFLNSDPKGKQIPGYLALLAEHLSGEQAAALKGLAQLQKNVELIKDIVSMQQNCASVAGVAERVNAMGLVEDALRMNASSLSRRDIQILKEFEEVPLFITQKHKVLQILVNLIRNATQACDESGHSDNRLTLCIARCRIGVRLLVSDNGVGILPENLTRIFAHGFTTKKHGHGFGLHGAAIVAKELGGSLTARSDGAGRGATFILELPLEPPGGNTTPLTK
jgi:PAS domain S-box-containing protein